MIPWFYAITLPHESKLSLPVFLPPLMEPCAEVGFPFCNLIAPHPIMIALAAEVFENPICFPGRCLLVQTQRKKKRNQDNLLRVTVSLILKLQSTLSTLRACRNPFPLTTTWNDSVAKTNSRLLTRREAKDSHLDKQCPSRSGSRSRSSPSASPHGEGANPHSSCCYLGGTFNSTTDVAFSEWQSSTKCFWSKTTQEESQCIRNNHPSLKNPKKQQRTGICRRKMFSLQFTVPIFFHLP